MNIKSKVLNKISTVIDFKSKQVKFFTGVIMGLLGAGLGAYCANQVFSFSSTGVHSPMFLMVTGGLLFFLFLDKVFF